MRVCAAGSIWTSPSATCPASCGDKRVERAGPEQPRPPCRRPPRSRPRTPARTAGRPRAPARSCRRCPPGRASGAAEADSGSTAITCVIVRVPGAAASRPRATERATRPDSVSWSVAGATCGRRGDQGPSRARDTMSSRTSDLRVGRAAAPPGRGGVAVTVNCACPRAVGASIDSRGERPGQTLQMSASRPQANRMRSRSAMSEISWGLRSAVSTIGLRFSCSALNV